MEQKKQRKPVLDEKERMIETVNRVEAVLFSSGKKVPLEDLKKLCRIKEDGEITAAIAELKNRYNDSTSLMIVEENSSWKMTIRERYITFIKKIVTETELSKTLMETLAVIAWKQPSYQSAVIKIRTNKAYDHIAQLEEAGFIATQKSGRTKLIKLTSKFYDYFDVHNEQEVHEMFADVKVPANINEKLAEAEAERIAQEAEDAGKQVGYIEAKDEAKEIVKELEDMQGKKEINFKEMKVEPIVDAEKDESKEIVKELEDIEGKKEDLKFEEAKPKVKVEEKKDDVKLEDIKPTVRPMLKKPKKRR